MSFVVSTMHSASRDSGTPLEPNQIEDAAVSGSADSGPRPRRDAGRAASDGGTDSETQGTGGRPAAPSVDAGARLAQPFGDEEGELKGLAAVQPRIAMRVIAVAERLLGDRLGAAGAFGDVLPGHLEMHAAGVRSFTAMDRHEGAHLAQYAVERTGFVTGGRFDRVAMHRIARPHDVASLALDASDDEG